MKSNTKSRFWIKTTSGDFQTFVQRSDRYKDGDVSLFLHRTSTCSRLDTDQWLWSLRLRRTLQGIQNSGNNCKHFHRNRRSSTRTLSRCKPQLACNHSTVDRKVLRKLQNRRNFCLSTNRCKWKSKPRDFRARNLSIPRGRFLIRKFQETTCWPGCTRWGKQPRPSSVDQIHFLNLPHQVRAPSKRLCPGFYDEKVVPMDWKLFLLQLEETLFNRKQFDLEC